MLGFQQNPEQINHETVVAIFAKMHHHLSYPKLKVIRQDFPDCIAIDNDGNEAAIEFEVKAMDFEKGPPHDIKKCDRIVCWEDDWGSTAPEGKVLSIREWLFG